MENISKIGIKISGRDFNAAIVKITRKYRNYISIAEIKRIISAGNYLYECDYMDGCGIATILKLNDELISNGFTTLIYEHNQVTTVEFLKNLLDSYNQTVSQVEAEMNLEALTGDNE